GAPGGARRAPDGVPGKDPPPPAAVTPLVAAPACDPEPFVLREGSEDAGEEAGVERDVRVELDDDVAEPLEALDAGVPRPHVRRRAVVAGGRLGLEPADPRVCRGE